MSDIDPRTLANGDLEAEVATLSAQLDVAEHRLLALISELDRGQRHRDHGLPSMATWLSWRVGLGPVAAREKVRVAKALAELPHISLAFSRAEVRRRRRVRPSSRRCVVASGRSPARARMRRAVGSRCGRAKTAWCASKRACTRTRRRS